MSGLKDFLLRGLSNLSLIEKSSPLPTPPVSQFLIEMAMMLPEPPTTAPPSDTTPTTTMPGSIVIKWETPQ